MTREQDKGERWILHHGDCLAWLRTLPSESVDSVVTDPPAGIAFMGKAWDHHKGGRAQWVAWLADVMRECLRVLKPGGHALVWSLPRTEHWTACAVEDAGFEIRDGVYHLCAQGWPKSLDVSKAIDAAAGAEREVIGSKAGMPGYSLASSKGRGHSVGVGGAGDPSKELAITAPATDDAKRWHGWGTALKPAHEKWILARKKSCLQDEIRKAVECVTRLIASAAENESKSSEVVDDRAQDSAPKIAERRSATPVASFEAMGTSPSESATVLNLSIASSWLACLEELSLLASRCTTETASRLTTDLRTLNSCLSQLTPSCTHDPKTTRCLCECSARDAALIFGVVQAECDAIRARFAAENAGAQTASSASQRELLPVEAETLSRGVSSERWILARKPLVGTVAANVLAHGVGALNVDGCRVPALSADTLGRWPSNVVLSHAETCGDECDAACPVAELDRQSGILPSRQAKLLRRDKSSNNAYGGHCATIAPTRPDDDGGASRFFPCFHPFGYYGKAKSASQRGGKENRHPTVKNVELMRWLVRLVTPRGGLVLDAFGGSGTTGVAAILEGCRFIAAEADADSVETARARLALAERGEIAPPKESKPKQPRKAAEPQSALFAATEDDGCAA